MEEENNYKIRVKHLIEENTIIAAEGEMIISQISGHISIKDKYYTRSITKDMEAWIHSINDNVRPIYTDNEGNEIVLPELELEHKKNEFGEDLWEYRWKGQAYDKYNEVLQNDEREYEKNRQRLKRSIALLEHDLPNVDEEVLDSNYDIADLRTIVLNLEAKLSFIEDKLAESVIETNEILNGIGKWQGKGIEDMIDKVDATSVMLRYGASDPFNAIVIKSFNQAEYLVEYIKNRVDEAEYVYAYLTSKMPMARLQRDAAIIVAKENFEMFEQCVKLEEVENYKRDVINRMIGASQDCATISAWSTPSKA